MAEDLVSTLERASEYDALAKLRPGEPYFPLIGRDRLAPPLVQQWADANRRRAVEEWEAGTMSREEYERECRKSTQAEMVACDMRAFKKGEPTDPKDAPREDAPLYSGHVSDPETKRRDRLQSHRARTSAAIGNAVSELADLQDVWRQCGDEAIPIVAELEAAIRAMKGLDDKVRPERVGIKR